MQARGRFQAVPVLHVMIPVPSRALNLIPHIIHEKTCQGLEIFPLSSTSSSFKPWVTGNVEPGKVTWTLNIWGLPYLAMTPQPIRGLR